MKTTITQFAAAIAVVIFTAVSIFSMTAKSDTKINKTYKVTFEQNDDSTSDNNGNGKDTTDGSGGTGIPTKE